VDYKKKLGILLGVAVTIGFVVQRPQQASGMARAELGHIGHAADKLRAFVQAVTGGQYGIMWPAIATAAALSLVVLSGFAAFGYNTFRRSGRR
jgi:hypothetical protein